MFVFSFVPIILWIIMFILTVGMYLFKGAVKGGVVFYKYFHYIGTIGLFTLGYWFIEGLFSQKIPFLMNHRLICYAVVLAASVAFVFTIYKYRQALRAGSSMNGIFTMGLLIILLRFRPKGNFFMSGLLPLVLIVLLLFLGQYSSINITTTADTYYVDGEMKLGRLKHGGLFIDIVASLFYTADAFFALYIAENYLLASRLQNINSFTIFNSIICTVVFAGSFLFLYIVDLDGTIMERRERCNSDINMDAEREKEFYEKYANFKQGQSFENNETHQNISSSATQGQSETDFFVGCKTEEDLTKHYHKLCTIYHPDNQAGDEDMFRKIDEQYHKKIEEIRSAESI